MTDLGSRPDTSVPVGHTEVDGVAVLTLQRPERRNAMVPEMMQSLLDWVERLSVEQPAGIVMTGAGSGFCVGADLTWLESRGPADGVAQLVALHHAVVHAMRVSPVPIVAAVNGSAAGGGMSLALAADYRVASPAASFTPAYFRIGLTPDGGNSAFLVRILGASRTLAWLLSNTTVLASEAQGLGLVNEVAPVEAFLERACTVARDASAVPAQALQTTRHLLDSATSHTLDQQLQVEAVAMRAAARQPAFAEAVHAFASRRTTR